MTEFPLIFFAVLSKEGEGGGHKWFTNLSFYHMLIACRLHSNIENMLIMIYPNDSFVCVFCKWQMANVKKVYRDIKSLALQELIIWSTMFIFQWTFKLNLFSYMNTLMLTVLRCFFSENWKLHWDRCHNYSIKDVLSA